ncbi:unnamed protein product [Arabis nemorensis]|uniref:Myb/SANT-like domain-containing protein n=1 Tax=Arabis nemorensis TaxID=586526 RepID=A0A565C9B8_9BRAS|nr:unnamed protein product [Arabis nemorensis]
MATSSSSRKKIFKNHYDNLKTWYIEYQRLSKKIGVSINPDTKEIEMRPEWSDDRIQEILRAAHVQKKQLQDLNMFEKVFANTLIGTDDGWVVGNGPDGYVSSQNYTTNTQTEGDESDLGDDQKSNFHETPSTEVPTHKDKRASK